MKISIRKHEQISMYNHIVLSSINSVLIRQLFGNLFKGQLMLITIKLSVTVDMGSFEAGGLLFANIARTQFCRIL